MRKEATLEQWRALYEAATKIKERKPWETFGDMDLIGIQTGPEEDTAFFCILGKNGDCYGVVVYEGYEGLNTYMMLAMQQSLHLMPEYAMSNQKNLTCYWGNRDELTAKQRQTIKELGYKYRGKNQWLYFMSFEPGYCPYNLDADETIRMTAHLQNLETALCNYNSSSTPVSFEKANMFLAKYDEKKNSWHFGEAPLPFTSFQFEQLILTDEDLLADLAEAPKCNAVLEAAISPMGASVTDKKYDRPAEPYLCLLADAQSGIMIRFEMTEPDDAPIAMLAQTVVNFIFQYGAPQEILITNAIVAAGLAQICEVCGIKLSMTDCLPEVEDFIQGMQRFRR